MPRHVIVDGSNIATEGRTMPSLKQLNEAVTAFMQEFPDDVITVVVDATFGHRIDPSEVPEFDEAVAHNELVAPPAGAIGRGDSFILSIANKTKGSILTNDSYQEFHGQYPWVFDEGRLIGGKPVPNVGWVFVLRSPVRGPVSRKSVRAGRSVDKNTGRVPRASKEASQPMPVPKAPPPGAVLVKGRADGAPPATGDGETAPPPAEGGRRRGRGRSEAPTAPAPDRTPARPAPGRDEPVNELMAFIDFVEHHPVGTSVNAVVESYSSHGAYVTVGDVRGYVPLRLMSDPPARSARELGKVGDAVTLVVHSFTPARRSIDMAVPAAAQRDGVPTPSVPVGPAAGETAAIAEAAVIATAEDAPAADTAVADSPKPARRGRKPKGEPSAAVQPELVEAVAAKAAEPAETAAVPARRSTRSSKRAAASPVEAEVSPTVVGEVSPTAEASESVEASEPVARPTARRGRKAAAPAAALPVEEAAPAVKPTRKRAARPVPPEPTQPEPAATEPAATEPAPAKPRRATKKAAAKAASSEAPSAPGAPAKRAAKKGSARTAPAKPAAEPSPVVADAAAPAPAKKRAAKQAAGPAEGVPAPAATPAKKAAAKKVPAKKAPAQKAPAKKTPAKPAATAG